MKLNKKYQIDNVSIDEISNETVQFLNDIKMESKNQLRIRLLVEEILFGSLKNGGETVLTYKDGKVCFAND